MRVDKDSIDYQVNLVALQEMEEAVPMTLRERRTQRVMLRLMVENRWIDEKKFRVSMEMLYEIGKILGELIKQYAKNNKK